MPQNPQGIRKRQKPAAVSDYAFSTIEDWILQGRIPPGGRLSQLALAQELDVDQRTVREALGRLVASGLAVHTPNKGTRVISLHLEGIEEIYTIRGLLEPWAMSEAAQRIQAPDLELMRTILPLTAGGDSAEGIERAREANRQFHWIAINACGRDQLIRLLDQVWSLSLTYAIRGAITSAERARADSEDLANHLAIVNALTERNGKSVAALTKSHISRSWKHLAERWKAIHGAQAG